MESKDAQTQQSSDEQSERMNEISLDQLNLLEKIFLDKIPGLEEVRKGHAHRDGSHNAKQDFKLAAEFYFKALEKGNLEAAFSLGRLYELGLGVDQDYSSAVSLYEKAANSDAYFDFEGSMQPVVGVAEAQYALGRFYFEGAHVQEDKDKAIQLYEKAIINGNHSAANNLGLLYLAGNKVKKNLPKAEKLLLLAYSKGNEESLSNLVNLYLEMSFPEKALEMHLRAIEKNCKISIERDLTVKERIEKMIQAFELTEIPKWEKEHKLGSDNLSQIQRIDRYNQTKGVSKDFLELYGSILQLSAKRYPDLKFSFFTEEQFLDLEDRKQKGSPTALKLFQAMSYFVNSMACLMYLTSDTDIQIEENTRPQRVDSFISNLSEAIKLEHSICKIPSNEYTSVKSIVEEVINEHKDIISTIDENARLCLTLLLSYDHKLSLEYLSSFIQKYPLNKFFHYFQGCSYCYLQDFKAGIASFSDGLSIDPHDPELLYGKAAALRITGASDEAITSYREFVKYAPNDHMKVPEAYYGMSSCLMAINAIENSDEIKKFYSLGLQSEKDQLSLYLPYDSTAKALIKSRFPDIEDSSTSTKSTTKTLSSVSCDLDFYRIELITEHRKLINNQKMKKQSKKKIMASTLISSSDDPSSLSLSNGKQIFLRDIDTTKDNIFSNCHLIVTYIDIPCIPFVENLACFFLIEDENRDVQRMAVYGLGNDSEEISSLYKVGCIVRINSPYMRVAADGKPMIRVNDPQSLVIIGYKNKMCRLCGKENCKFTCSKCKSASYCSKNCQQDDWKILNHSLICS